MEHPPYSPIEAVTEILHGTQVTDPYRWLEDQESPRTRGWISAQTRYARAYLDSIPRRETIRERIRELLDVETCDSLQRIGSRYFFRKRLPGEEQPSICVRDGIAGADQIIVDPSLRGTGPHTAVKPLRISPDGRLLLYEVKQGGERTGTFELLDIQKREVLPDVLPRGYLRGFAFANDSNAFYYVHETVGSQTPLRHAVYKHILGTTFAEDQEIFLAGQGDNLRINIVPGKEGLGVLVIRFGESICSDFFFWKFGNGQEPEAIIRDADYQFGPILLNDDRIFALTDRDAPNLKIVEVRRHTNSEVEFLDVVPNSGSRIQGWVANGKRIFVSYLRQLETVIEVFDLSGTRIGEVPVDPCDSARLAGTSDDGREIFFERESFTKPVETCIFQPADSTITIWAKRNVPFDPDGLRHRRF